MLGADGFIGSHFVRMALQTGWKVRALCVKTPWRLAGLACRELFLTQAPVGRWWDDGRAPQLEEALAASDALVMLTYEPPPPRVERQGFELSVNAEGARRVAALAVSKSVPLVFASSADVYGVGRVGKISELDDPVPVTPYARAKLIAEDLILETSTRATSLRLATVFGSAENGPRAIPSFIRSYLRGEIPTIHGDGSDVKDYVRVEDVAAGLLNTCAALVSSRAIPTALNLGSGIGRTTLMVLEMVADVMDVEPLHRHEPVQREARRVVLSTELASQHLAFAPVQDLAQALHAEVDWLDAHINQGLGTPTAAARLSGQ